MKHCKDCVEFMCGQSGTDAISEFCGEERQDNDTAKPTTEETTTASESGEGGMALVPKTMNTEEVIAYHQNQLENRNAWGDWRGAYAESVALEALREKATREFPQPLTLEELRKRHNEPVWVKDIENSLCSGWRIIYWDRGKYFSLQGISQKGYVLDEYGKTWLAYDNEPKEVL